MLKFTASRWAYGLKNLMNALNPCGRDYYWITGVFSNPDQVNGIDTWAIAHNYVAVVHMNFDFTDYKAMKAVEEFDFTPKPKPEKKAIKE